MAIVLPFPHSAIFFLPRLLCGIWLFSVCAHMYKFVCICGCVLCPCLAGCAPVKMLLSDRYFISREKQACSCTKTSSPGENAHTHTHTSTHAHTLYVTQYEMAKEMSCTVSPLPFRCGVVCVCLCVWAYVLSSSWMASSAVQREEKNSS